MKSYLLITAAILLTVQAPVNLTEGVYSMCDEVSGYSGEVVELKGGKFRYWFYSDVSSGREPEYPLTGSYTVAGATLTLDHKEIRRDKRTIAVVNGADVLWRDDGLKLWEKEKRIHPYAVLIRMAGVTDGSKVNTRPSIKLLYTKEMEDREKKEYEERYKDLPAAARVLFRARTRDDDADLDEYRKEIAKAREQPDPKLVGQLIGLMGRDVPTSIEARMILEDLFQKTFLVNSPPPFLKDPGLKKKALETLIDGLSSARDRTAVEHTLMQFLQASDAGRIALAIPETPLTVRLEFQSTGAQSYGSEGTPADDINWLKVMPKVIPACQKWMREQLAK